MMWCRRSKSDFGCHGSGGTQKPAAWRAAALVLTAGLLTGCAGVEHRRGIATTERAVPELARQARDGSGRAQVGNVLVIEEPVLGDAFMPNRMGAPLPAATEKAGFISFDGATTGGATSCRQIVEVMQALVAKKGVSLRFRMPPTSSGAAATAAAGGGGGGAAAAIGGTFDPLETPHLFVLPPSPLSKAIAAVETLCGLSAIHEDGMVRFRKRGTRTFPLAVLPDMASSASTGGKSGAAGNAGGGVAAGVLKEIQGAVRQIVGGAGEVHFGDHGGEVVVSAPDEVLAEVEEYLRRTNSLHSSTVSVQVRVLTLNVDDSEALTFSLQGALEKAIGGEAGFLKSLPNAGAASLGIVSQLPAGGQKADSADAIAGALHKLGKVSGDVYTVIDTQSDVESCRRRVKDRYFSIDVQQSPATTLSAPIVTSKAEKIPIGFAICVRPRVLPGGRVAVKVSGNISAIEDTLVRRDQNGEIIQERPIIARDEFDPTVELAAGDSMIIGVYGVVDLRASNSGPVDLPVPLLGGSRASERSRYVSLILLTPHLKSAVQGVPRRGLGLPGDGWPSAEEMAAEEVRAKAPLLGAPVPADTDDVWRRGG